jgi:multidrug efflux pump subunit AcrA (membrane-fusion protein)
MKTTLRKLQIIAASATIAFSFSACDKKASTDAANTQPKNVGTPTANKTENAEKKGPPGKGGGGRRDAGPVAVRVEIAKKALAPRSVSITAPLDGRSQADVFTKVTGRLTYIGPKEGEAVKAGTVLFRMDRNDPGETFLNMPVVSPINGWVGRWMVKNIGAQITPTTPVVTVVDDDFLRTTIYLSTSEWVAIDDKAVVSLSVGDERREGKIVSIARAADSISGRGSAVIEVENKDHKWRVGMIARVQVDLEPKMRMLVSSAALNITDQGTYVFVVENDAARKAPVKFALVDSDTVEILEGIEDGSAIVVAGGNFVTDKAAVKVVASEATDKKAH